MNSWGREAHVLSPGFHADIISSWFNLFTVLLKVKGDYSESRGLAIFITCRFLITKMKGKAMFVPTKCTNKIMSSVTAAVLLHHDKFLAAMGTLWLCVIETFWYSLFNSLSTSRLTE